MSSRTILNLLKQIDSPDGSWYAWADNTEKVLMSFDLHVVESEVRDLPEPVQYHGQELSVSYYPAVITTAFAAKMQASEENGDVETMANGADGMIADWDMYKGKEKVEPNLETLKHLPLDLLAAIFAKVMDDATVTEDAKNE